jgi:hypothetical protein
LLDPLRPSSVRRAKNRNNFADLVHLRSAQKERFVHIHFSDDASNCKDVDCGGVDGKFEEEFGCPVPPGGDVLSVGGFAADFARDAEIDDFDGEVVVDEDVFGFEVAVEEALLVDVEHCFSQLLGYEPDLLLFQLSTFLLAIGHEFVEVLLDVLEDEVGLVDDADDLLEFDYVGVVHLAQGLHFGQLQTLLPRAVFLLEALDRHDLFGLPVLGFLHVAERARAQLFQNLVLLH